MPSMYDLLAGTTAPESNTADAWSGSGLLAQPPQTEGALGGNLPLGGGQTRQGTSPSFLETLQKWAQKMNGQQGVPQLGAAGRPPTAAQPMPASQAGSHQGFLTGSSRGGFDLGDLMKVAALVGTFGAGGGLAGAVGAGGAGASAGAAGGGAMGGGGLLGGGGGGAGGGGGLGGLLGGGGGGGQSQNATPVAPYAPLPQQTGPLVPQSANQWDQPRPQMPWMYWG